jgi:Ca2+-binding RTX toxin-like protein
LSDTASNLAGAASSVLSGATAITATDAATVAQADILIASGKPVSYSLADTGVNLVVGGIAAAAINGNMNVTVTGPAISVATYDAIDVANGTGTISGYSLSDTGANLVVGGTAVTAINGNVNVAVTGPAISVADYDAIDSANGSGTISGFSIADDAAAITASAARNSAVDIVVTGGATAAQTTNLLAATNAGATTIDEVTATGAEASAFVFNTTGDDTITLLTVTGTATAQQATRVGELLISDDVGSASLSVSDFYTSVQAMKQTPSGQIALSTAAAITAFGDQNPNFIDMGGFTENLTIEGLGDNDTIYGGSGDDTISGGTGDDVIRGGAGDDDINAGSGDNTVGDAGFGADTITHDDVGTVVISVTGTDIVTLTATSTGATVNSAPGVSTTVNASTSTEAVTFNGNTGNDSLLGGDGDDTFNGFEGQDTVDGGAADS